MTEERLLENNIEDLPDDHSTPFPENGKLSGGSRYIKNEDYFLMKKEPEIENLGDFLVFGYYSIFFIFVFELIILPMMANMNFMVYGGFTPTVDSCGENDFREVPSLACEILDEVQKTSNCTPQLSSQFYSVGQEFGYYCESAHQVKNSISIQMFGMLLGAVLFGQLSDLFGRRRIMLICYSGMAIFGYLASTSSDLIIFTLFQFGALFFTGGTSTIGNILLMETIPKKHRVWISLVISFSPNYIIFAAIAYFAHDWRILLRVMSFINVLTFVCLWIAHESPRWLIQKGALGKAKETYEKIERWNGTASRERQKVLEKLIQKEVILLEQKKKSKKYYFHHLFYTWDMIKYNFVISFLLFSSAVINYALIFNMEKLFGSVYLNNVILGVIRYTFNVSCGIIDFKFPSVGQKKVHRWTTSTIIVMLLFIFIIKISDFDYPWTMNIVVFGITTMCSQLFVTAILVTGELFPTPVRNIAVGFQQIFTWSGVVVSPHFFYFTSFWDPAPYLFMIVFMTINLVLFHFLIPESKGHPMDDHMPTRSESIFKRKSKDKETEVLTENESTEESKNES